MNPDRIKKGLWWDRNWEVLNGCNKVSPACDNCFAESYIHRFKGQQKRWRGLTDRKGRWNGVVRECLEKMSVPLNIKKPTVFFVTERGDIFHPKVDIGFINSIYLHTIAKHNHTFLVLTKRVERLRNHVEYWLKTYGNPPYLYTNPNIYHGVTAENQEMADKRIPHLLQVAGQIFLSIEPLLGEIDLGGVPCIQKSTGLYIKENGRTKRDIDVISWADINAVIVGAESIGNRPGRECKVEWIESIVDQCKQAGVPCFVKQIHLNGKLVKDIDKFPKELQVRELPWL
jgi:protein gp37